MKTKNLYLIRHGETDWNRDKRFQGQTDIQLNQQGREQATALIPILNRLGIESVFTSHLARAFETAQIATSDLKLALQKEPRLREANIGQAEGLTLDQLEEKFGQEALIKWRSYEERDLDYRYPEGETKRQMMVRVRDAVLEISQNTDHQNIALFSHGMLMRALTFVFQQGAPWDPLVFSNGSIHHFSWTEDKPEHLKYHGRLINL